MNLNRTDEVKTVSLPLDDNYMQITHVCATTSGVYVSTLGGGVFFYERATGKIRHYTAGDQQLPSDFCYNVCTLHDGRVLITSDRGVTCLQPHEKSFITLNLRDDFSSSYIINGCGMFVSDEGRIFIGDTQGVTVLSEKDFVTD